MGDASKTVRMEVDMPKSMRKGGQGELPGQGYRALLRVMGLIDRVMQPYFGRFGSAARNGYDCVCSIEPSRKGCRACGRLTWAAVC